MEDGERGIMSSSDNTQSDRPELGAQTQAADDRIVARLKICRSMALEFSAKHFPSCLMALEERLFDLADNASNNQDQVRLFEIQKSFKKHQDDLIRYFCGSVGESYIKFKKNTLDTHTEGEHSQRDSLSLLENEKLEESIAISSIALRADNVYAELIWKLNQRYSVLRGGAKVDESSNPSSPIQFCEGLRRALTLMELDVNAKVLAYKAFDKFFIPQLGSLLEDINDYLASEGLLPNLQFTPDVDRSFIPVPSGAGAIDGRNSAATENFSPANPAQGVSNLQGLVQGGAQNSAQYQGNLVNAIRELQNHLAHESLIPGAQGGNSGVSSAMSPSFASGGARTAPVYSSEQLVGALQNMQADALSITSAADFANGDLTALNPQGIATTSSQLTRQLQQENDEDGAVDHTDMHTIDLVGMLFEYMLADDNLPPSVKALLSYLHTPFLKMAFIDKDFFEQSDHPARLLLNNLAEAGTKWVSIDGSSQYEIYPKIKSVVSQLLEKFENDVRIFAELLMDFNTYTKKISRRQELMERRALEKVQGEEKLREVKMQVNREVRARTDNKQLPSAVLLLLLQPWSDYLSFSLLRYGENSESWREGLDLIDEILWSIEPKESNEDKTRQVEVVENIAELLEQGFDNIGYDQVKAKKLLDALFSLQKLALQSKQAEPAPAVMRDKLESLAAEKAGETPDAELVISDTELKMVENLKLIEFGTWFEFEEGKRLKVAWYNSKTSHYMLVDQMGKKVAMSSGLDLARGMIAGKVKVIAGSTKPFFERALENILHSLNARADGDQAEDIKGKLND